MKGKFFLSSSESEKPIQNPLQKYSSCPVCKNVNYSIIEGCKNCTYKNRFIGIYESLSQNPEAQAAIIDKVIALEEDADREKIIQKLGSNLNKEKGRFCPKCKEENYEMLNGCAKCGYLNPWANKVVAAFASCRSYVPISEMYFFEVETNRQ